MRGNGGVQTIEEKASRNHKLNHLFRRNVHPRNWQDMITQNIQSYERSFTPLVHLEFNHHIEDYTVLCGYALVCQAQAAHLTSCCCEWEYYPHITCVLPKLKQHLAWLSGDNITEMHLSLSSRDSVSFVDFPNLQRLCLTYTLAEQLVKILRTTPFLKSLIVDGLWNLDVCAAIGDLKHLKDIKFLGFWIPETLKSLLAYQCIRNLLSHVILRARDTPQVLDHALWDLSPDFSSNFVETVEIQWGDDKSEDFVWGLLGFVRRIFPTVRRMKFTGDTHPSITGNIKSMINLACQELLPGALRNFSGDLALAETW